MQIRFISTLTAEDEARVAEMIVDTAKAILANFPLGYMLRVETADAKLFEHNKVAPSSTAGETPRPHAVKVQTAADVQNTRGPHRPKES